MMMDEDQAYDSAVISPYSEEKGLVRQQLDSFEEFIQNTMQQIVDESADIDIQLQNPRSHRPNFRETICRICFGKIYLSKPMMTESDGATATLFPKAARLKNISYSASLYVDVSKRLVTKHRDGEYVTGSLDLKKVFIGKVPIMLRSGYCTLYQKSKTELTELGECPFDQGGYFVINGKVRTAEEKMSTNHVHVFKTRQPNKYSHVAEVWSTAESRNRPPSTMFVRMLSRAGAKEGSTGQYIKATLPYIKTEIPIITVFRALGFVADEDILEQIRYDFADAQMMELLLPSFEEASVTQNQQVALDYIGTRGVTVGVTREERIKYARDILQKEMLADVGVGEFCETKKAYYIGYIVHRLLLSALGRRPEDDRDHYGNKRLDLAGRLLGGRFRMLFRKFTRDVRSYAQESVANGKDVNFQFAIKAETITSGLEYSLATGNWWQAYGARTRAGVSQLNGTIPANSTVNANIEAFTPLNIEEIEDDVVLPSPGTRRRRRGDLRKKLATDRRWSTEDKKLRRLGEFPGTQKPNVWRSKAAFEKRRKKRKDEQEMLKKKTKKKTTTTNKNVLSDDLVVTQILTRLPAKSLMRFKSVCKPWKSIIEQDLHFINLHCTRSRACPPRLLTIILNRKTGVDRIEDNGKMRGCFNFLLADLDCGNDDVRGAAIQNLWTMSVPSPDTKIMGPLRGLLCFVEHFQVLIFDFSTRQCVTPWIRSMISKSRKRKRERPVCKFGFDHDTGEHKVIFVWRDCCEVLTVGVDSDWRIIDVVPPAPQFIRYNGVYANDSIYWMSMNKGSGSESLVAFDIGPEKFRMIRIPQFTLSGLHPSRGHYIMELDGCPTVVRAQTRPTVKLWKFHDGKKEVSNGSEREDWSEVRIEMPRDISPSMDVIFHPIPGNDQMMILEFYDELNKCGKERLVMNVNYNSFYSYNRVNKTFSKFEIQGVPSLPEYFDTCCEVLAEDLFLRKSHPSGGSEVQMPHFYTDFADSEDIVFTSTLCDDSSYKLVKRFNKQTRDFKFNEVFEALNMHIMLISVFGRMVDESNKGSRRRRRNGDFSLKPNVWRSKAAFEKRRKKRKDEQEMKMKKKKTKKTTTTNKNVLNDDLVVTQILTRLPAKSLMRFKSVCKPWKSTIEQDSHFISLHRTHSQARHPSFFAILNRGTHTIWIEDNRQMRGRFDFLLGYLDGGNGDVRGAAIQNSWDESVPSSDTKIRGPLGGLLCFIDDFDVEIYNLSTRQRVTPWIRSMISKSRKRKREKPVCEFGFDHDTGEHKVIFVWHDCCEVLTVGVDSDWRIIDAVPPAPEFTGYGGVYANGSIYWMSMNKSCGSESFVAFDIGPEKFRMLRIPEFTLSGLHPSRDHYIIELDGCPTVVRTQTMPTVVKLWKFHDRKKEGSNGSEREDWSEVSIEMPCYISPWMEVIFHPIPRNDQMMILEFYDVRNKCGNRCGKERLVMNVNYNSFYSYNRVYKTFSKFEIQGVPLILQYCDTICDVLVEDVFPDPEERPFELRFGRQRAF
ncbi:DNA-directed RNA polymerase II subunit 2 [Linum grandiflorum]